MLSFDVIKTGVMTVTEVARYFKISVSKVYRMANESQIPAFRIGKSWRLKQDMIDAWIQEESNMRREK